MTPRPPHAASPHPDRQPGDFVLGRRILVQPRLNRLVAGGTVLELEPLPLKVLEVLAARAPEVVTRDELLAGAWSEPFASEDSLYRAISILRDALSGLSARHHWIDTVRKVGYRLACEVDAVSEASSDFLESLDGGSTGVSANTTRRSETSSEANDNAARDARRPPLWPILVAATTLLAAALSLLVRQSDAFSRDSAAPLLVEEIAPRSQIDAVLRKTRSAIESPHGASLDDLAGLAERLLRLGREREAGELVDEARRRAGDSPVEPLLAIRLKRVEATVEGNLGAPERSVELARDAYAKTLELPGRPELELAESEMTLGEVLSELPDESAIEHLESSLERRRRLLGDRHPQTTRALCRLGLAHFNLQKIFEAETYSRQCVAQVERYAPDDPLLVAQSQMLVSAVAMQSEEYEVGISFGETALAGLRAALRDDRSSTVANLLGNMAFAYYRRGDYERAESMYRRAFEIQIEVVGPSARSTLLPEQGLALALMRLDRLPEAEAVQLDVLDKRAQIAGRDSAFYARALNNYALLLLRQERYDEAFTRADEALRLYAEQVGEEQLVTSHAQVAKARSLVGLRRPELAVPLLELALDIQERALGPDAQRVRETQRWLADARRRLRAQG